MQFKVCYKGISRFTGSFATVMRYLEEQWGSAGHAYEIGVRLQQVSHRR